NTYRRGRGRARRCARSLRDPNRRLRPEMLPSRDRGTGVRFPPPPLLTLRKRCARSRLFGVQVPDVQYVKSGDVHIAYQVTGDGPFDLVFVPGYVTHMELQWKLAGFPSFLTELGEFCRLIRFDKRGTGMSDPVSGAPSLETRMDDARAVMDAAGSRRAAFFGLSEGAAMSILFAATYPERTAALIVRSCSPRTMWAPDFPWGRSEAA